MILILQPGLGYRPASGVSQAKHRQNLRLYLWTKANGLCVLCGFPVEPNEVSPDHIIPVSRGGEDGVHNLQATHWGCNKKKSSLPMADAVREIRTGVKEYRTPVQRKPRPRLIQPTPAIVPTNKRAYKPYVLMLTELKSKRQAKGWTIDDLARESGFSRHTLFRLESAVASCRISTMAKLAEIFECTPVELMGREP